MTRFVWVLALGVWFSPSAFAQSLVLSGRCPGRMQAAVSGIQPLGEFALVTGGAGGSSTIPQGRVCAGTRLPLRNASLVLTSRADRFGETVLGGNVPQAMCSRSALVLDTQTCQFSSPVPLNRSVDADGDGYSARQDCDDTDPAVNPGVFEVRGDGIDNNCDGVVS